MKDLKREAKWLSRGTRQVHMVMLSNRPRDDSILTGEFTDLFHGRRSWVGIGEGRPSRTFPLGMTKTPQ